MTTTSAAGPAQDGSAAPAAPPPPPFDPELAAALAVVAEHIPPVFTLDLLPSLRGPNSLMPAPTDEDLSRGGAFEITERRVPGPAGAPDISLLICRPTGVTTPTAALYNIHGGGMIIGDRRTGLAPMLEWAEELGAAVVSVEYRLAPETPHPGPVEDCYAGLVWTAAHAGELGIDQERIVVAGASAGGGLAAAVALLARDRGGPALAAQLLLCPMLDDRNDTPSARQMAGRGVWDQASNEVGWTALLGAARGGPDVSPYAAPARATDLSGLAARVHRRRLGGDVPGRGRHLRQPHLAGRRSGGTARLAGRLPRVRAHGTAGRHFAGGGGRAAGLAAPRPRRLSGPASPPPRA